MMVSLLNYAIFSARLLTSCPPSLPDLSCVLCDGKQPWLDAFLINVFIWLCELMFTTLFSVNSEPLSY